MEKRTTISDYVANRVAMAKEQNDSLEEIMGLLRSIIQFKKIDVSYINHGEGYTGYVIFECVTEDGRQFFFEIREGIDDVITSIRPVNNGDTIPYARRLNSDAEKRILTYFINNYQNFSSDIIVTNDSNGYALLVMCKYDMLKLNKITISYQSYDGAFVIKTFIDNEYKARTFGFGNFPSDFQTYFEETPIRVGSKKIEL